MKTPLSSTWPLLHVQGVQRSRREGAVPCAGGRPRSPLRTWTVGARALVPLLYLRSSPPRRSAPGAPRHGSRGALASLYEEYRAEVFPGHRALLKPLPGFQERALLSPLTCVERVSSVLGVIPPMHPIAPSPK